MTDENGHVWSTRSRHPSTDGVVEYQHCVCGLWRVQLSDGRPLAERIGSRGGAAVDVRRP